MKCTIPEISWHNRDPVLSVDIQPKIAGTPTGKLDFNRLASGGTDSHVLIWHIKRDELTGSVSLDVAADLTRHQRAVNCVRWSPSGELLASGDDESVIMIWKMKGESEPINILDTTNEADKEIWITLKVLRGHMEDVYDLNWSPNSLNLISGSVDNTAIVWDVQKGKSLTILNDHKGFVQGVSWDPLNQYLATLSTDRYFRVFDINTKKVVSRNSKCVLPVAESSPLHGKSVKLFHDDTLQTFFRRLSFSPDGQLIVTPSGVADVEGVTKPLNTTYIYTRYSLKQPVIVLPSPDQYTVAVRFCPVLFELNPHDESQKPIIPLPYRMVFAVATKSSVYLYDTQQKIPFGVISNIHYTRLTDLTWSADGEILIVSSTDGFCSIIIFNENELGVAYREPPTKDVATEQSTPPSVDEKPSVDDKKFTEKKTNVDEAPKPIAIRRAPRSVVVQPLIVEDKTTVTKMESEDAPKQIEVQRSPRPVVSEETKSKENTSENVSSEVFAPIIRSDEKFESPEQVNLPVTPIAIRRHPRTTNTPSSTTKSPNQPATYLQEVITEPTTPTVSYSRQPAQKKATPIAIRRKQREPTTPVSSKNLVTVQKKCDAMERKVETDAVNEEAVDAWPIVLKPLVDEVKVASSKRSSVSNFMDTDATEDIRLVVTDDDESEDEVMKNDDIKSIPQNEPPVTPIGKTGGGGGGNGGTPKTPRRVDFKTISTPKSKKKLL